MTHIEPTKIPKDSQNTHNYPLNPLGENCSICCFNLEMNLIPTKSVLPNYAYIYLNSYT